MQEWRKIRTTKNKSKTRPRVSTLKCGPTLAFTKQMTGEHWSVVIGVSGGGGSSEKEREKPASSERTERSPSAVGGAFFNEKTATAH